MAKRKRIGILTSGGDCGGLNAVIRAVVRRARDYDMEVYGIKDATAGLMARPVEAELLDVKRVSGILRYGGTVLGTVNKGNPFAYPMPDGSLADRSAEVITGYHRLGLDALIGVGGDGSLAILRQLALQGDWNFVGVPKTIDNDVGATEYSVGFNTALSVAIETRVMILGHLQRGGTPSPLDRLLGAAFGVAAVDLIAQGKYDRMVAWQNRRVVEVPLAEAVSKYQGVEVHGALVATAIGLNTYVGELEPQPSFSGSP